MSGFVVLLLTALVGTAVGWFLVGQQRDKAERKKQRKLDKAQGISDTEPTAEGAPSETEPGAEQSQPTQEDGAQ